MADRSTPMALPLLLALLAAGCVRDEPRGRDLLERAIEASGEPVADVAEPPSQDENIVTLQTEDGLYTATAGDDLPLPPGFPGDIRLPADARVQASTTRGTAISLSLHSPRSADPVFEGFRAAQRQAGWREAEVIEQAPVRSLGLRKDARLLEATFTSEPDGGTAVSLTLRPASG